MKTGIVVEGGGMRGIYAPAYWTYYWNMGLRQTVW